MNKFDIIRNIEKFAPPDTQEKWDCSGWIVCTRKNEIEKIMLALTVTDDIVAQAKENRCEMIISHHPLFCVPPEYSDIDIYCAHTNIDKADGGTTDTLIKSLGYSQFQKIGEFVRIVTLETPIRVVEFANSLRQISPNMRYVNNKKTEYIQKIGFCAGSGSDLISELKDEGIEIDAFVTGDLKYHTSVESNIVIFDIGHFESEILILPVFQKIIGVDCCFAKEKNPFIYYV